MIIMQIVKSPRSRFVRVLCKKCKNEQIIYNKAMNEIKCDKCEKIIAKPTGGEIIIAAKILEILN